jgi:hypothetical protein
VNFNIEICGNLEVIWEKVFLECSDKSYSTTMSEKKSQLRLGKAVSAILTSLMLSMTLISALSFPPALAKGAGPPGGTIWADDISFRTVATPTNLPHPDGAPFDVIYTFPNTTLASVSESKPGDQDFNGGRWHVYAVEFLTIFPTQFTNDQDILTAASLGQVSITPTDVYFECPLIRA